MSVQNVSENSNERYVINSYAVPEETIREGADLVSLCGIRHVAFIMDGNGRWATSRGLPRESGHKVGMDAFERVVEYCADIGIQFVTVYAFSTENWKRPPEEIDGIMQLLRRYLHECIDTMERDGNRLRFLGDLSVLDDDLMELIRETNEISARIEGFQANVCLNYGGGGGSIHAPPRR